nr:UDP-3-O-acyl-N-acetylglucosamine deacetylase [uncultured Dethiosulfovibrio sp.]
MTVFDGYRIKKEVHLSGTGLHSGKTCTLSLFPCKPRGIHFRFGQALWSLSDGSPRGDGRGTILSFPDGNGVMTVEHLLAALRGLGIDGVEIVVSGGEIPAMDGSAAPFVQSLLEAGLSESEAWDPIELDRPIAVDDLDGDRSIIALPWKGFKVTYVIDYPSTSIGTQCLSLVLSRDNFIREIAPCRTFALMEEIAFLRDRGLSLGGSLDNAVVVDGMEVLAKGGLRFPDEFVRHKILDLIGDLSLLGRPLSAHVIAIRAGHRMHHSLGKTIRQNIKRSDRIV